MKVTLLKFVLFPVMAGLAVWTTSAVLTASNTVPSTNAGQGSGAISGYTITSPAPTLNATDPSKIDAYTFTISPTTASLVKITLDGTNWYTCTNTVGSVSCTTTSPQATVSSATALNVVART